MTDKTDSKERDLMDLVDAYAEARHIGGCHTYNAKTAEARNAVIAKLAHSGFDAADMATAAAQGFRDGVASIAASAGSEPVAVGLSDPLDALHWGANVAETLLSIGRAIGFGRAQQILGEQWEAAHNCAPRGRMGVIVKDEATCQMCGGKPYPGCNTEFQGEAACRFTHPSPPEGMVGGWISVEDVRKPPSGKTVVLWVWAERYQEDDDGRQIAQDASGLHLGEWREAEHGNYFDNYTSPFADREAVLWWMDPAPPTLSADSRKGE